MIGRRSVGAGRGRRERPAMGERGCPMVPENSSVLAIKNAIDISVVINAAHCLHGKDAHEELPAVQNWSHY